MNCSSIYQPEPDVAGQAVFIAFLSHTGIFIFLALVITPIVQIYLPPVRVPNLEQQQEDGGEFAYDYGDQAELLRLRLPEEDLGEIELNSGDMSATGAGRETETETERRRRRIVYRCYCQEAIESTYTSQYIAGVAFAVTAFVKHASISYYHLRIIYCLLAMNTTIGLVTNFGTASSKIRFRLGFDRKNNHGGSKWKMIDIILPFNMLILLAFSIYLFINNNKDERFSNCYKHKIGPAVGTLVWFLVLAIASYKGGGPARSALQHFWFSILISGFVAFQTWQIQDLARTFRTKSPEPGQPDERSFTFGQILVLFMIVPLIGDFLAALIADLRKIETNNWRNGLRSFANLFLVLFPYFLRNVWDNTWAAIQRTLRFLQRPFSAIRARASDRIEGLFLRPVRAHQNQGGGRGDSPSTSSPNLPTSVNAPNRYTPPGPDDASISHERPPSIYPQKRPSFPYNMTV